MADSMQPGFALEVEGLSKTYATGAKALEDVTIRVERGEFFGLLGPNGAGKTTLIGCLAGLVDPTSGRMTVMGVDAQKRRRKASLAMGIVPQEITFDPFLTVMETLRYQSGYWGLFKNDAWIGEILARLALTDKADTLVRALSGGMKRRVLVAQALVHKPPVIVLDEPTAGVDVALRECLWSFIGELHSQGHTVVLTTHYLAEAQSLCDRIAILNHGRVAALDRTESLLSRFEGRVLRCRFQGELPDEAASRLLRRHGEDLVLRVRDSADVERLLSVLNRTGRTVENLVVAQPGLEDVFLALTDGAKS